MTLDLSCPVRGGRCKADRESPALVQTEQPSDGAMLPVAGRPSSWEALGALVWRWSVLSYL